jgi:cytochrome c oxidase assembly protein subunit 20
MGWWPFNRSANTAEVSDQESAESSIQPSLQPIFLDDVAAKYTNEQQQQQLQEGYSTSKEVKSFLSTLTLDHFHMSNLVQIPCFREAGLSGFACFFVFSSVLFFYHKNFRKAINWGFGGLLLGSIFGWEHCNNTRRNSQMAVRLAQERFEKRQKENKD